MKAADRVRKNIIKIREQKGYTQERLAYESDISKGFLSEVERGLKVPSINTLEKIAETLDVNLSDLIS